MPYANPEEKKANGAQYRLARRCLLAAKQRDYYQQNRKTVDAQHHAYLNQRPLLRRALAFANTSNRRAAKFGVSGKLYARNVIKLDGACVYCDGEAIGWDHVVALALGGSNSIDNIVRACTLCNKQKGNKSVAEFQVFRKQEKKRTKRAHRPRSALTLNP